MSNDLAQWDAHAQSPGPEFQPGRAPFAVSSPLPEEAAPDAEASFALAAAPRELPDMKFFHLTPIGYAPPDPLTLVPPHTKMVCPVM